MHFAINCPVKGLKLEFKGRWKCPMILYGDTLETMEVHAGKCCSKEFDCGLCDIKIETLENLKTHLV